LWQEGGKKRPTGDGSGVERIIGNPNGKILDDEDTSICHSIQSED
jgi:hypothetical protein